MLAEVVTTCGEGGEGVHETPNGLLEVVVRCLGFGAVERLQEDYFFAKGRLEAQKVMLDVGADDRFSCVRRRLSDSLKQKQMKESCKMRR